MTATQSIRREVFYSGRVQGVGFRWTVRHIAQSHAVTGFVKNLEDGRVQLVVEGATAELDRLLAAISERMGEKIKAISVVESPTTGQFREFEIVH